MDLFIEYLISRKKTFKDALIIFATIIGVVIIGFGVLLIPLGSFSLLLAVGVGYAGYFIITSRNIEYEYASTNGKLDVDKIIAQRKRKRILSIHCKEFEIVAPLHEEKYKREFNNVNITKTIDASSTMQSEHAYFAVFTLNGEKCRLIFEPTQKMLDAFKVFIPRNVFERQNVSE